jgi:hypothetical protein
MEEDEVWPSFAPAHQHADPITFHLENLTAKAKSANTDVIEWL